MPYAVTHILVPILIVAIIRDFYLKKNPRRKFSLHYVLLAGLGGVLPDIDIPFSILFYFFGVENWYIHKTFLHSLFFPIIFLVLFVLFKPVHTSAKICNLTRHKLKLNLIFLMIAIGILTHVSLDALLGGQAYFFFPFSLHDYSAGLFQYLPDVLHGFVFPLLDGILLVIWIAYLELKHKISDFI